MDTHQQHGASTHTKSIYAGEPTFVSIDTGAGRCCPRCAYFRASSSSDRSIVRRKSSGTVSINVFESADSVCRLYMLAASSHSVFEWRRRKLTEKPKIRPRPRHAKTSWPIFTKLGMRDNVMDITRHGKLYTVPVSPSEVSTLPIPVYLILPSFFWPVITFCEFFNEKRAF